MPSYFYLLPKVLDDHQLPRGLTQVEIECLVSERHERLMAQLPTIQPAEAATCIAIKSVVNSQYARVDGLLRKAIQ